MPGEFYIKGKTEKANIKGLEDRLDSPVFGLAVLKALIDVTNGKLDDSSSGLVALKALLDAMKAEMDDPGIGLANLLAEIDANEAKIDIIDALVDAIKTQTDKLTGIAPEAGSVSKNWQAAEQDLITLGAHDIRNKLHLLIVDIHNLAGTITIRLYMQINGVERMIFPPKPTTWNVAGGDSPAVPVVNGTMGLHEAVRVTVQSDNAADDGQAVIYDYMLEAM